MKMPVKHIKKKFLNVKLKNHCDRYDGDAIDDESMNSYGKKNGMLTNFSAMTQVNQFHFLT